MLISISGILISFHLSIINKISLLSQELDISELCRHLKRNKHATNRTWLILLNSTGKQMWSQVSRGWVFGKKNL